jgi:hypothetical protein
VPQTVFQNFFLCFDSLSAKHHSGPLTSSESYNQRILWDWWCHGLKSWLEPSHHHDHHSQTYFFIFPLHCHQFVFADSHISSSFQFCLLYFNRDFLLVLTQGSHSTGLFTTQFIIQIRAWKPIVQSHSIPDSEGKPLVVKLLLPYMTNLLGSHKNCILANSDDKIPYITRFCFTQSYTISSTFWDVYFPQQISPPHHQRLRYTERYTPLNLAFRWPSIGLNLYNRTCWWVHHNFNYQ